jgi:hypothetical protein
MSITGTGLDRDALPTALLVLTKSHLRVDHAFDDDYIKSAIARGISWFERETNVSVNPVTWEWLPDATDFVDGAARVPPSPVNTGWKVEAGGDVTADYKLTTMSQHGVGIYALEGVFATGMKVTLPSGYADQAALDPGILDAILRTTAHLYENREILAGGNPQPPRFLMDVVSTYWMPRA